MRSAINDELGLGAAQVHLSLGLIIVGAEGKIVNSCHYLCRCSGLDRDGPPPVILNIGSPPLQRLEGQNPGPNKHGNASGLKLPCCH